MNYSASAERFCDVLVEPTKSPIAPKTQLLLPGSTVDDTHEQFNFISVWCRVQRDLHERDPRESMIASD
jgi:hypothetical protein